MTLMLMTWLLFPLRTIVVAGVGVGVCIHLGIFGDVLINLCDM